MFCFRKNKAKKKTQSLAVVAKFRSLFFAFRRNTDISETRNPIYIILSFSVKMKDPCGGKRELRCHLSPHQSPTFNIIIMYSKRALTTVK